MAGSRAGVPNNPKPKRLRAALVRLLGEDGTHPELMDKMALAMAAAACEGDVAAFNAIADRMDGKVPQALVGDSEHDPISVQRIEREIIEVIDEKALQRGLDTVQRVLTEGK